MVQRMENWYKQIISALERERDAERRVKEYLAMVLRLERQKAGAYRRERDELKESLNKWKWEWSLELAHSQHAEERIKELEADNALLRKRLELKEGE